MSLEPLLEIIASSSTENWQARNKSAFETLFGSRYHKHAAQSIKLRAPEIKHDDGVPFAAYIHPSNPDSGSYTGTSFVIFPLENEPCLIAMVTGTQGLSPDEAILGRPGHARKMQAICHWLNHKHGSGSQIAWAKQDPTRIDLPVPGSLNFGDACRKVFARYGKELYAIFKPTSDSAATADAVAAFLDILLEERGYHPLKQFEAESNNIRSQWFSHLMPSTTDQDVLALLHRRRYVIIQGPPGTGKTRMARQLLRESYDGFGRTIQFHPNTTYENFVGGLAPLLSNNGQGLQFAPVAGALMQAAAEAQANPGKSYLLHIDEINRADLGKILGEAIYLLEPNPEYERDIALPYDFGPPFQSKLALPGNLHILGTMNTADRSIAIVDVAVRRRFAFLSLWPSTNVVEAHGCAETQKAYRDLLSIFIEHAGDDAFSLIPGHSYFLGQDPSVLKSTLAPLLEEYLAQGYVTGFAEYIRSYLQWLKL
ncbi:MAG: restriction endonuclease [Acidimicrobiia bacterium]|nr:restriction endonuclease [Acidimicrobiia bacterium]